MNELFHHQTNIRRLDIDMSQDNIKHETVLKALEVTKSLQNSCLKLLGSFEEDNGEDRSLIRKDIMTDIIQLRPLNRQAQIVITNIKDQTAKMKQEVDTIQLDMQNIYYQHKHLKSEIERCEDYESKHETIDLIPVEEFLEESPQFQDYEAHELIIERLKDEEQRRLQLFITKTRLAEKKSMLSTETKSLKDDLEDMKAFNSQVNRIIEAAEPLRKTLDKHQ